MDDSLQLSGQELHEFGKRIFRSFISAGGEGEHDHHVFFSVHQRDMSGDNAVHFALEADEVSAVFVLGFHFGHAVSLGFFNQLFHGLAFGSHNIQ